MDQERSEIGVSPFRDPQKDVFAPTGVLLGDKSKIGRKVAAVLEPEGISHHRDQNGGRENSNAGNGPRDARHLRPMNAGSGQRRATERHKLIAAKVARSVLGGLGGGNAFRLLNQFFGRDKAL